ncbi:T9SS type A sorting domain-containing protein [Dyadobacter sp. CY326]|uniref:T9SS type A sorting domain-containing protein n=1 Tax=Dyadobacter sp. CY326 TaxID=2907300 RepID=UPI001F45EB27|nr:T9SS type A sorting domain-containing protein [Dyadobacter sp. CY326]MCE7066974.1 T9SS type A sorting domain-containing protein [Dyadobacter sp. CY326]
MKNQILLKINLIFLLTNLLATNTTAAAPDVITSTKSTLNFSGEVGSVSDGQTFILTFPGGDGQILIDAPAGYEIKGNVGIGQDFGNHVEVPGTFSLAFLEVTVRMRADFLPHLPGNHTSLLTCNFNPSGSGGNSKVDITLSSTIAPRSVPGRISVGDPIVLNSFREGEGPSVQSYNLDIIFLLNQEPRILDIISPNDFEISLLEAGPFSSSLSFSIGGGLQSQIFASKKIFVRLKGNLPPGTYTTDILHTPPQAGAVVKTVTCTITPSIATAGVSPASLTGFKASSDAPSVEQNYLLSATDLPAQSASQFTILAPVGFQVSSEKDGPYQDFIIVDRGADDQDNTTDFSNLQKAIFVRLKAGLTPGLYSGDVVNVNALTGNHKVAVSGEAFDKFPQTITSDPTSITALNTIQGTASGTNNFLLRAKGFISLPNGASMHVRAPANFEISQSANGPFSQDLDFTDFDSKGDLTKNVLIRIKSNALAGTLTGNIEVNIGILFSLVIPVAAQVAPPPATALNPDTLTLSTPPGTPSPVQNFTISGTGLPIASPAIIGVSATAPDGYELALAATGPFSDAISTLASVANDHTASRTLFIRLKGTGAGVVDGKMNVQMGNVQASILTLKGLVSLILPVTLSRFSAKPTDASRTLIEWETTDEVQNEGFEIQKSTDALTFHKIGWMDGQGTSKQTKRYSFTDENANTTSYYRLKQIDFDGKFTMSRIVVVVPENESITHLNAFPNPSVDGLFNVQMPELVTESALFDIAGKKLEIPVANGKLDLRRFPSGLYMLKIQTKEEQRTIRLMKSN